MTSTPTIAARPDRFTKYANTILITEHLQDPVPDVMVPHRVLIDGHDVTRLFPLIAGRHLSDFLGLGFSDGAPYVEMVLCRNVVDVDHDTREVWIGRGHPDLDRPLLALTPPDPADDITVLPLSARGQVVVNAVPYPCTRLRVFFGSITIAPRALDCRVAT
jgi:hypothetical protein